VAEQGIDEAIVHYTKIPLDNRMHQAIKKNYQKFMEMKG
jgi:mannitol-1-phosphate 5-dehydrogenase